MVDGIFFISKGSSSEIVLKLKEGDGLQNEHLLIFKSIKPCIDHSKIKVKLDVDGV